MVKTLLSGSEGVKAFLDVTVATKYLMRMELVRADSDEVRRQLQQRGISASTIAAGLACRDELEEACGGGGAATLCEALEVVEELTVRHRHDVARCVEALILERGNGTRALKMLEQQQQQQAK